MYFVRIPEFVQKLYSSVIWRIPNATNAVYLTFDDGPHPEVTPWVLDQLRMYNAKATFFCIGQNAEKYPELIERILAGGHALGNHSFSHKDGWKTKDQVYLADIEQADKILRTSLFRPPYGRIKRSQIANLQSQYTIVNWSLMPGDFDVNISAEACFRNLMKAKAGDIICLHDNERSMQHLKYILPRFLDLNKSLVLEKLHTF
jgi:peptidoglycan/xylan/chitin deacetylase (PgdA/CDA1 family)